MKLDRAIFGTSTCRGNGLFFRRGCDVFTLVPGVSWLFQGRVPGDLSFGKVKEVGPEGSVSGGIFFSIFTVMRTGHTSYWSLVMGALVIRHWFFVFGPRLNYTPSVIGRWSFVIALLASGLCLWPFVIVVGVAMAMFRSPDSRGCECGSSSFVFIV